jgi:hypothetical protein
MREHKTKYITTRTLPQMHYYFIHHSKNNRICLTVIIWQFQRPFEKYRGPVWHTSAVTRGPRPTRGELLVCISWRLPVWFLTLLDFMKNYRQSNAGITTHKIIDKLTVTRCLLLDDTKISRILRLSYEVGCLRAGRNAHITEILLLIWQYSHQLRNSMKTYGFPRLDSNWVLYSCKPN